LVSFACFLGVAELAQLVAMRLTNAQTVLTLFPRNKRTRAVPQTVPVFFKYALQVENKSTEQYN
ncbi:MAG: hypothetical protein IJE42_06785, partial [Bacteroidaceae bacterium]|nr:hypothetical protein [Bacteroidaceae bacterium]